MNDPLEYKAHLSVSVIQVLIKILKHDKGIPEDAVLEECEEVGIDPYFYRIRFSSDSSKHDLETYIRMNYEHSTKKLYEG